VQKIIDRIIFLRICEDRAIEPYGQLQTKAEAGDVYTHLLNHFRLAESKYNSGIFDFDTDRITQGLRIDDRVLKTIIQSLYYPKSPYEFSVLGVEILGNVYEQFLGKVIRLTAGHQAKVETKPEVKKAGGVYYTPQYIVDYIVRNTVGKLVEGKGKTPEEIAEIKILDPACGSGSFLIGAYTYLLRYHLDWYVNNEPKKYKEAVFQVRENEWYLTTAEKKRILLNNIFGVDIDPQAVEVTKLSLLLKVLEHESRESIDQQVKLGLEGVLPNLEGNVKCGNSLIGLDFYGTGQQETLFDEAEMRRINVFDWDDEGKGFGEIMFDEAEMRRINVFDWDDEGKGFGEIMKRGGFDVVVGNPPYVRIQTLQDTQPEAVQYYKNRYKSGGKGNFDIYALFVEQGYSLVNKSGLLGCILPHKFFQAKFGDPLREIISNNKAIYEIVHFGAEQVFENATTYTCLLFLSKMQQESFRYVAVEKLRNPIELVTKISEKIQNDCYQEVAIPQPLSGEKWEFYGEKTGAVISKLKKQRNTLGSITRKIFVGLQTSADKIYVLKIVEWKENTVICYSNSLEKEIEIEKSFVKPFLMGKDVHRYDPPVPQNVVIFPYQIKNGKAELMTQKSIKEKFPLGWKYLLDNKTALENRERGKMRGEKFYAYGRLNNLTEFEAAKLMTPEIALGCQLSFDSQGVLYHTTKVYSFIFQDSIEENELFFLGILNSKLLWFFLKATGYILRGGYFTFETEYLKPFPIRTIDFSNPTEKAQHDKLVALVDTMLELHKKHHDARMETDKGLYEQQIKIVDAQIDRLVYDLYGLTEEEIRIVEEV
jgi:type I restriction-modification system DNA methylase subunit